MNHSRSSKSKKKQRRGESQRAPRAAQPNGVALAHADGAWGLRFMGVSFDSLTGRYRARLTHEKRTLSLGLWPTLSEAALARDRAALHLRLEVPLNFPRASTMLGGLSPAALRALARRQRRHDANQPAPAAPESQRAKRAARPSRRKR